ncbi:MAG: hypothetical protein ACQEXN_11965 [Actinomycetota bacterium]
MAARWYLIQYTHELRRHEPRNVGVAVEDPEGRWHLKFLGETQDSTIAGNRLRGLKLDKDLFTSWVQFLRRKAAAREWEDVLNFQAEKPTNISVRNAGIHLLEERDWESFTDQLFSEMVDDRQRDANDLDAKIRRLLTRARVAPKERVRLLGKWKDDGIEQEITFDFAIPNSPEPQIMAKVAFQSSSVHAFKGRVDAVHRVAPRAKFVAFTSFQSQNEDKAEELLMPLEAGAHPIDVDAEDAPEELCNFFHLS